jgi:hypothetical protein
LTTYTEEVYAQSIIGLLIWANIEAAMLHISISLAGLFDLDFQRFGILLPRL